MAETLTDRTIISQSDCLVCNFLDRKSGAQCPALSADAVTTWRLQIITQYALLHNSFCFLGICQINELLVSNHNLWVFDMTRHWIDLFSSDLSEADTPTLNHRSGPFLSMCSMP